MKRKLVTIGVLAVFAAGALLLTAAQPRHATTSPTATQTATAPTIDRLSVAPRLLAAAMPTQLTVTAQLTDSRLIPGSVNLLRVNAAGGSPAILGVMHDDGLRGDVVKGDGTYTVQITLTEPTVGSIQLQVSAAFTGALQRVKSAVVTIDIGRSVATRDFSVVLPPTVEVLDNTNQRELTFQKSGDGGFGLVLRLAGNAGAEPLQRWILAEWFHLPNISASSTLSEYPPIQQNAASFQWFKAGSGNQSIVLLEHDNGDSLTCFIPLPHRSDVLIVSASPQDYNQSVSFNENVPELMDMCRSVVGQ